jgi:aminoglycoside phosphotransferase (APT) family kinase protein
MKSMPAAEVDVSPDLVRELLSAQHPDLADLPVELLANGWDNVIFRLGDDLLVRLPRRALGAQLVIHEQQWLPVLAPRLPLQIPAPVRAGQPAEGYPWPWSVVPFLRGELAATTPLADPGHAATVLGRFLNALHEEAPPDAPINPVRGGALATRTETVTQNMTALGHRIDRAKVQHLWGEALGAPPWDRAPVWLHGDLHPANILVSHGQLTAVIDFGDITSGDPATDLSAAWMLFTEARDRDVFWDAYRKADDNTKARAQGWALGFSLVYMAHSADNPLMAGIGERLHATILGGGH